MAADPAVNRSVRTFLRGLSDGLGRTRKTRRQAIRGLAPEGLAAMSVGAREMEISIRNSRPCGPGSVFGSPRPRAGGGYLFAAPPPVNGLS